MSVKKLTDSRFNVENFSILDFSNPSTRGFPVLRVGTTTSAHRTPAHRLALLFFVFFSLENGISESRKHGTHVRYRSSPRTSCKVVAKTFAATRQECCFFASEDNEPGLVPQRRLVDAFEPK